MTAERRWWVLIWVMLYAICNTGFTADALVWAPTTNTLAIKLPENHFTLQLASGEQTFLHIPIINIGTASWHTGEFYLQPILPGTENFSLSPVAQQPLWSSDNQTLSYKAEWGKIDLGGKLDFQLPITAPISTGKYRMYLQPVIDKQALPNLITLDLKVGKSPLAMAVLPAKRIEVNLTQQTLTIFEGPYQLAEFIASTGRPGWETPPGRYIINKKLVEVWSDDPINLWLPNWMELRDLNEVYEGYGIHGVPYRKITSSNYQDGKRYSYSDYYTDGKLYEGYFALGKAISQGCIVTSLTDAAVLFSWAEPNQTLVNIQ